MTRTKLLVRVLALALFILSSCIAPLSSDAQTVYVTKTGKKYHKENCRYLKHSKYSISLEDAKKKYYTACAVCKPSSTISNNKMSVDSVAIVQKKLVRDAVSSRCEATTKAGTRCKRTTKNVSGKCWQHE